MKNRLVFRILGALASALIIVSVFIPFVSVTGYSQSLWEANELINALYLPIMIIVFGSIGVLSFATNIKTELAYASSGALLFYIVTQVIPVIDEGMFNTLSVGFYCLAIGTVLTGIMAFICNLKVKVKIEEIKEESAPVEQESMLNQIDKLYNDQVPTNNEEVLEISQINPLPIQPLGQESVIQPLSVQTIQPLEPVMANVESQIAPNVEQTNSTVMEVEQGNQIPKLEEPNIQVASDVKEINNSNVNPFMIDNVNIDMTQELAAPVAIQQQVQQPITIQPLDQPLPMNNVVDPINKMETSPQTANPVTAEFEQPQVQAEVQVAANPVTAEFEQPQVQAEVQVAANQVIAEFGQPQVQSEVQVAANPVTAEFGGVTPINNESMIQPLGANDEVTIQPLSSGTPTVDVMADSPAPKNSDLDIFG